MAAIFWDVIQHPRLLLMVAILGIGGSLQVGFQGSMITYASVHIKEFINETWLERFGHSVDPSTLTLLWSSVVSIFGLGGLLGSISSGCLAARYGKKNCFLGSNVLMVASSFFLGFSKTARGDEEGCVKAMKTFWGEEPHRAELDDLRKEQAALSSPQSKTLLALAKDPSVRWQLCMMLILAGTTQLSGIQAIYSYTFEVLQAAGFHLKQIPYLALGVSLCEFLSTILCSFIIEQFGRKVLLWTGYALMGTMLAGITLAISLQPWLSWMPYCSLSLIFCFVFVFGMGPAGATVSLRMEIFDQSSRAPAFAISGSMSWVGVFVIGMLFPLMMENFHQFSFLIFMGILYTSGFIIYCFLPETKKKSILEIQEEFDKLNFKKKQIPVLEAKDHELCTKL